MTVQELSKITIVDFDDSFTFNIYSSLCELFPEFEKYIEIVHYSKIFLKDFKKKTSNHVLVLGPGPGHPDEYDFKFSSLKENKNIFIFAICLGHQLFWQERGLKIEKCLKPLHGQSVSYIFDHLGEVKVQRYNSLVPKIEEKTFFDLKAQSWALVCDNNELIYASKDNVCTMQFHPESIGTSCPQLFFQPIRDFLL